MTSNKYGTITNIDPRALRALDEAALKGDAGIVADAIDVVGVLSGLKPSAFIGGNARTLSDRLLDQLGLVHTTSTIKGIVYVSFDQSTVEHLANLHEKVWEKTPTFLTSNMK